MRTKSVKKNKINVITLGCSKNTYDSEVLMGQLKASGKDVVHEQEGNIVVINTCGFIDNAKAESVNTILEYADKKSRGIVDKVFVTGCLSERYRPDLEKEIPNVDQYFGTTELPLLLKALGADYKHELLGERLTTTPKNYAYLKIAEGCDRPCSFCAIPLMRGKHVSQTIEKLVKEAEGLAKNGVKELILIAQDLTYYGLDIYKKRMLPELLNKLAAVEGLHWIRLHYAYPSKFPIDIIDAINAHPNICNYLDMPLQHASDRMLKAMNRQITQQEMKDLIKEIRNKIPGICLRTTLIAGFPGETREDVDELKSFLAEMQFDRVGIFTYSHEEDTSAFKLEDSLSSEEKESRAQEIIEFQQEISFEKNQAYIGKVYKVMVDKKEAGRYIGRTEFDSVEVDNEVIIHSKKVLKPGDFVNVLISKAYDYDLEGEVVD